MMALPDSARTPAPASPAPSIMRLSVPQTSRNPFPMINDKFYAPAALSDARLRWRRPQNPPAQYRFSPPAGREALEDPPKKRMRGPCRIDLSPAAGYLPERCSDEKSCVGRPPKAAPH